METQVNDNQNVDAELVKSVKEFKSPPIRFILYSAIGIIGFLTSVIIYQSKRGDSNESRNYNALVTENFELKKENKSKDSTILAMSKDKADIYLRLYEADQHNKEFAGQLDSVNKVVVKINNILK